MDEKLMVKIIKMFSPVERDFLDFPKEDVIQGPNDRAVIGFDTFFPIKWLVEDYGFTEEEAKMFVSLVNKYNKEDENKEDE